VDKEALAVEDQSERAPAISLFFNMRMTLKGPLNALNGAVGFQLKGGPPRKINYNAILLI
jgi:hypothetical protein